MVPLVGALVVRVVLSQKVPLLETVGAGGIALMVTVLTAVTKVGVTQPVAPIITLTLSASESVLLENVAFVAPETELPFTCHW